MLSFLSNIKTQKTETLNTMFIDSFRLLKNLQTLQSLKPDSTLFPVLKSNAYGHGLQQVASILKSCNAPYICVDSIPEYQLVKKFAKKKSLLLGETLPQNYTFLDHRRITPCVYTTKTIKSLIKTGRPWNIHLFLNTGMNREGIQISELDEILNIVGKSNLQVEGVMSHFANADEIDYSFCNKQIESFKNMYTQISNHGFKPIFKHIGNTAAIAKIKDPFFNARRTGIGLYGYSPLLSIDQHSEVFKNLLPSLEIRSTVVGIQRISKGDIISYGGNFTADKDMSIATVPYGYTEGLTRSLKNNWRVLWNNTLLDQVGTICMNLCMIDVTGKNIEIGDKLTIISKQSEYPNTINNFARKTNTITYEVLVNLDPKAKRIII